MMECVYCGLHIVKVEGSWNSDSDLEEGDGRGRYRSCFENPGHGGHVPRMQYEKWAAIVADFRAYFDDRMNEELLLAAFDALDKAEALLT